ncbi:MAG TPA: hypothetical protein VNP92_09465 [Actinophytocola sp.]|nr:hypothetical protein [Actinophytocola sp.]
MTAAIASPLRAFLHAESAGGAVLLLTAPAGTGPPPVSPQDEGRSG